jgi:hypothetical protein
MNEKSRLNTISEKVYIWTFFLTTALVFLASIGTAIARWMSGNNSLELIPDNVFDFIKEVIFYFVVPISLKISGDTIPQLVEMFQILKHNNGGVYPVAKKGKSDA